MQYPTTSDNINDMRNRQAHPFAVVIPLSALVVTAVLLLNTRPELLRSQTTGTPLAPARLIVEHTSALTLTITMSAGKTRGIVEMTTETDAAATVSVPSSWQRREVRGAGLDAVSSSGSSPYVTRWRMPPGVTLSLWTEDSPALSVSNPSGSPLLIIAKRITVETGTVEEKSVLIQGGTARVW